jgi:hypothetical protein
MTRSRDEYLTQTAVTLITTIGNSRLYDAELWRRPIGCLAASQQAKALDRSSKKCPRAAKPKPAVVKRLRCWAKGRVIGSYPKSTPIGINLTHRLVGRN